MRDAFGSKGPCTAAKILLPLHCIGYGVPPHIFCDYFQMSPTASKACFDRFVLDVPKIFFSTFLSLPTTQQLNSILALHNNQHGINGMIGLLDCMHCKWKKCPKAYQGAFEGAKQGPTIVLESISDYNLYFWHAAFGFPGSLNDMGKRLFALENKAEHIRLRSAIALHIYQQENE